MEDKDLDLTLMNVTNKHYDIERIKKKSIQDKNKSKIKHIFGELYKGKNVTSEQLKVYASLALAAVGIIAASKGINHIETLNTYNDLLGKTAKKEMSYSESKEFLENYNVSNQEHYNSYKIAMDSLDDKDYTITGNRKDKTHNENISLDSNSLINLSDKEKDALTNAVNNEIEEYIRGK